MSASNDNNHAPQCGVGAHLARFNVYVQHAPPMPEYQQLSAVQPLQPGDIDRIYRHCGNGWRKIFNVYAKLLFSLPPALAKDLVPHLAAHQSWQQFRDQQLLQGHCSSRLLFATPQLAAAEIIPQADLPARQTDPAQQVMMPTIVSTSCHKSAGIHLIAGRSFAKQLLSQGLTCQLHWLDHEFAIDPAMGLLVTPFFDYRQLTNEKIARTAQLIQLCWQQLSQRK